MATLSKYVRKSCLIAALAAGMLATAGTAAAQRGGQGWNNSRHAEQHSVGSLIVNGNRFNLEGRRSIAFEIREALRCAGYRAYVHDGCVTVRFRGRQPNISLTGCEYGLRQSRSRGCITLRPYSIEPEYNRPVYRHRNTWQRHRQPSFRWHYTPRRRSGCDSGFRIRFGC
jgi:hypothetical protein